MHDFISVENVNEPELLAALQNLADLYRESGYTNGIEVSTGDRSQRKFLITFRNVPDFERFAYFVNYIKYPVDIEVPDIRVRGFYKLKSGDSVQHLRTGEIVQLYVSKNDTDYDNVSVVTANNESYLFDFGSNIKRLKFPEEEYLFSSIEKTDCLLIRTINPSAVSAKPESAVDSAKPWWKFW